MKLYVNGVEFALNLIQTTGGDNHTYVQTLGFWRVGDGGGGVGGDGAFEISVMRLYKCTLTQLQVTRNYDLEKARYPISVGLVLSVDASNASSYPGSGTVWTDLSGEGNNGTLNNGVGYSSLNGGQLTFDGTNDSVSFGNSLTLQGTTLSVNVWFKGTQQGTNYNGIVVKQNLFGIYMFQSKLQLYDFGNNLTRDTGVNISDNVWRHITVTYSDMVGIPTNNVNVYINGSLVLTTTAGVQNATTVGLLAGFGNSADQFIFGSIGEIRMYSTVLTPTKVLNDFNSTRTRYGI
jgi:hypothetical protein